MYDLEKNKHKPGSMSSGRAIIVATVIILIAIIALGIALGLTINQMFKEERANCSSEIAAAVSAVIAAQGTTKPTVTTPQPPTYNNAGTYRFGSVAADAQVCSEIGTEIMALGGSAVDTAIATTLCACVISVHNCGIGGGHFMTIYKRSEKKAYAIMARETAPEAANSTMFVGRDSQEGGLSIGVPGEIMGFYEAYKIGGKLPWAQLFEPTISLCRNGFKVIDHLAYHIKDKEKYYKDHPNLKAMVTDESGEVLLKQGDIMKLPKLARTLEAIATEGAHAFYNGSLTKDIVSDIQDGGGIITEADLMAYTAPVKDPLVISLRDNLMVYSPPPPASGAVYEFILGILDGYRFNSDSVGLLDRKILTWHRIVEAFKFAYAKRSKIGDSDVEDAAFKKELEELIANLTSSEYAANIRSQITDDRTHDTDYYGPTFYISNDAGTSHISVLAPNGDAVSVTSTINIYFGSKIVGTRTGIVFNDEMDDFSTPNTVNYFGIPASPANFIKPGKRPLSSMCPSIIVASNGDVKLVDGAAGGTKITTSTALTTMETLWFGMSMKEANDHHRLHHQLLPKEIQVEKGFEEAILDGLRSKGHNITMKDSAGCIVQGILRVGKKKIEACSDFRKKGAPDGF